MRTADRFPARWCWVVALALSASTADAGSLNTIASFTEATGTLPYSGVVFDNVVGRQSALYTVTTGGVGDCYKNHGCGSVVQLVPPTTPDGRWKFNVLHKFEDVEGTFPYGGLIVDSLGALYGVTTHDGFPGCHEKDGCGSVYKLTPPAKPTGNWTFEVLHHFLGGGDGGNPHDDLLLDSFGAIYGATVVGGAFDRGTVFKLTPPERGHGEWTKTIIYHFRGPDGARPRSKLTFDTSGAIYGTTAFGGAANRGTVFKLTPPRTPGGSWTNTIVHSFRGSNGALPYAGVTFDSTGALYGTTWHGGIQDRGVAFKLTPPRKPGGTWTESVYQFKGGIGGEVLEGALAMDTSGALYGTTRRGAIGGGCCGTLFRLIPPRGARGEWQHEVLAYFDGDNGKRPLATPVFHRGKLYGTADYGGESDLGTIFEYVP
jgi:uncharacterized repeat protein (TIGR03803 family)